MRAGPIYTETLKELRYGTRRIEHRGGQYSGKTVGVLEAIATLCSEGFGVSDNKTTTVTSMSMPHLKGGALRDFETFVLPHFETSIKKYHKTDHIFTFRSGELLEFKVFDSEFSARGSKRKLLFVNEANKFDWMTFWQLDSRSDQSIIDYNPTIRFWAHEKITGHPGNALLISDHRHNPFLSEAKHKEIESICEFLYDEKGNIVYKENGEPVVVRGDYELWKVYARGITGNVTGVIFPNWEMIDDLDFPKSKDHDWIYSIDFGYTNDPTAIIKCCKIGNTLFIKELAYETGLTPMQIKEALVSNGYRIEDPLYCEHDPDMVRALRNIEVSAFMARKGQGSINAGIELLKTFEVKYPSSSRNLHRERQLYVWEVDKEGKTTNTPVDKNNHCFDAIRYGVYTKYLRKEM